VAGKEGVSDDSINQVGGAMIKTKKFGPGGIKEVDCKCPKCGDKYTLKMFFTGRGTLRRYCGRCRVAVATVSTAVAAGPGVRRAAFRPTGAK
jgi:hypothetical protein